MSEDSPKYTPSPPRTFPQHIKDKMAALAKECLDLKLNVVMIADNKEEQVCSIAVQNTKDAGHDILGAAMFLSADMPTRIRLAGVIGFLAEDPDLIFKALKGMAVVKLGGKEHVVEERAIDSGAGVDMDSFFDSLSDIDFDN